MSNDPAPRDRVVRVITPAPRDDWAKIFEASEESIASQSPAWLDCMLASGACRDASRLFELESGRQLVLPAIQQGRPWAAEASLPAGFGIGGLIGAGRVRPSDVAAVVENLRSENGHRVMVKPGPLAAEAWLATLPGAAGPTHGVHMLDLDGGFERVWSERFTRGTRQRIRHACRSGITVVQDSGSRLIPAYHLLYDRRSEQRAHQLHRPRWFQVWLGHRREPPRRADLVAERLGEACRTTVVSLDGEPVAAVIVFTLGQVAFGWRYAYDRERAGHTFATYLVHSAAIEDVCRAGCRVYHMGESGGLTRIEAFKEHFGARRVEYPEFRLGSTSPVQP
jgi:hypothetical protein